MYDRFHNLTETTTFGVAGFPCFSVEDMSFWKQGAGLLDVLFCEKSLSC